MDDSHADSTSRHERTAEIAKVVEPCVVVKAPVRLGLDETTSAQWCKTVEWLVQTTEHAGILIDMSQTTSVNSTGIGLLLQLNARARSRNRPLVLVGLHGGPLALIKVTRIDSLMRLCRSVEEALGLFRDEADAS